MSWLLPTEHEKRAKEAEIRRDEAKRKAELEAMSDLQLVASAAYMAQGRFGFIDDEIETELVRRGLIPKEMVE